MTKKEVEVPTVLITRHQKTAWNTGTDEDRLKGTRFNLPITAEGRKEAIELARKLKDYPIASIKRSKMLRNEQSITPLGKEVGIDPVVILALDPWDVGYLSGQKRVSAQSRIEYYILHPHKQVPDGEAYDTFWDEFTNFLASEMKAAEKNPDKLRVLSSHSCTVLAAEAFINGTEPKPHVGKMPPPGSITAVEKKNGHWTIRHDFAAA